MNGRSCSSNCSWFQAWVVSMNTFMNLVKRSLEVKRTRGGVGASGGMRALVGASLLPALDLLTEP